MMAEEIEGVRYALQFIVPNVEQTPVYRRCRGGDWCLRLDASCTRR
jgi:hypothetical protein